jgi:hypothetical protein
MRVSVWVCLRHTAACMGGTEGHGRGGCRTRSNAQLCANNFDCRDTGPAPLFSTAVNNLVARAEKRTFSCRLGPLWGRPMGECARLRRTHLPKSQDGRPRLGACRRGSPSRRLTLLSSRPSGSFTSHSGGSGVAGQRHVRVAWSGASDGICSKRCRKGRRVRVTA